MLPTTAPKVQLSNAFVAGLLLLGAVALQGCADGASGFAGRYQVVAHTENATSCDAPGTPVIDDGMSPPPPKFMKLEDGNVFGTDVLELKVCTSSSDTACKAPINNIDWAFGLPSMDDGWGIDAVSNPSGTAAACEFGYSGTRVRRIDDQTIEIRNEDRRGTRAVKACELERRDLAVEGRTLPCKRLEIITLTEL